MPVFNPNKESISYIGLYDRNNKILSIINSITYDQIKSSYKIDTPMNLSKIIVASDFNELNKYKRSMPNLVGTEILVSNDTLVVVSDKACNFNNIYNGYDAYLYQAFMEYILYNINPKCNFYLIEYISVHYTIDTLKLNTNHLDDRFGNAVNIIDDIVKRKGRKYLIKMVKKDQINKMADQSYKNLNIEDIFSEFE